MSTDNPLTAASRSATPEELLARLEELGVDVRTVSHPAVFTVAESKSLRGELPGGHTKNLMLRNKKGRMWLVVCREDAKVDLRALGDRLGAGRLSFASPERLEKHLGVIPGAVTPFAVINDHDNQVQVVLDREALAPEPLNFHPLVNTMTTAISARGLMTFLEAHDHPPEVIDLD